MFRRNRATVECRQESTVITIFRSPDSRLLSAFDEIRTGSPASGLMIETVGHNEGEPSTAITMHTEYSNHEEAVQLAVDALKRATGLKMRHSRRCPINGTAEKIAAAIANGMFDQPQPVMPVVETPPAPRACSIDACPNPALS